MGTVADIAQDRLEQARWAVVINALEDAAVIEAIWPLIAHRMRQMGHTPPTVDFHVGENAQSWLGRHIDGQHNNLRESWGQIPPVLLYRPGERVNQWLARDPHRVANGPVDPRRGVPFYLMLVGRPGPLAEGDQSFIPLGFQYELDIFWGAGRLCFTDADGAHDLAAYRNYVKFLVARETAAPGSAEGPRETLYFGPRHDWDATSRHGADALTGSLIVWHGDTNSAPARRHVPYRQLVGEAATRGALLAALGAPQPPGLLVVAAHGLGFRSEHPLQLRHQGAIICQDWTGGPVGREQYLAGEDLDPALDLQGMVALLHASYSGACPDRDEFIFDEELGRPVIAPFAFCTQLTQGLLRRGAGAVIAMVERAWSYTTRDGRAKDQVQPLEDMLDRTMRGRRPGDATDQFNVIQGARAQGLVEELENIKYGKAVDPRELAALWMARNDARSYAVFGDPAAFSPYS